MSANGLVTCGVVAMVMAALYAMYPLLLQLPVMVK